MRREVGFRGTVGSGSVMTAIGAMDVMETSVVEAEVEVERVRICVILLTVRSRRAGGVVEQRFGSALAVA